MKKISLKETQEIIEKVKNLNYKKVTIDQVKELIKPLWPGYSLTCPVLKHGEIFYRGRGVSSKPDKIKEISYPSSEHVKKDQRANRKNQPVFYCSNSWSTTLYETITTGFKIIAISQWKLKEKLAATNLGYTNQVLSAYSSSRTEQQIWWSSKKLNEQENINQVIHDFFSEQFSKQVPEGNEHLYKISIAISEGMFGAPMITGELPSGINERQLGIMLYPSFARLANTDNAVFLPHFADNYLEFHSAEYIQLNSITPEKTIDITRLDFANSIGPDGIIQWKGRLPQWSGKGGEHLKFIFTEHGLIAEDATGKIIEPT